MPISYPTTDDLVQNMIAEFRQSLPSVDPTVIGSFAEAFVTSQALMGRSIIDVQRQLQKQLFPQTATGEFLDLWGEYEGLVRIPATAATGPISVTGASGVGVIPVGTQWTAANGIIYEATSAGSISTQVFSVSSITRSGTTATVTVSSDHALATGQSVTVSGANETDYNGTFTISVTGATTFTYQVSGSPTTPATGIIQYSVDYVTISVIALTSGADGNQSSGAVLTINTAINGIDDDALVQVGGLAGGAAEEEDDPYRERILLSRSLQDGVFTSDQIRLAALGISGNTRVFVQEPTESIAGSLLGTSIKGLPSANPTVDYASAAASASINISGDITIAFWLKTINDAVSTAERVIIRKSSSTANGWRVSFDPTSRLLKFGNTVGGHSSYTLPLSTDGQWIHVAFVLTTTNNIMYINGVEFDDQSGYALADTGSTLYLMGHPLEPNSGTISNIDEVMIFDVALNSDQVQSIYEIGVPELANLQAWWKMNEGTGTSSADNSGNSNTLTLTTASMWVAGQDAGSPGMIPRPGQVVVYVLRDNDPSIIPSQTILNQTKDEIVANGKKPAHMYIDDIFVLAPNPVSVDFTFTQIEPDTTSMRTAIETQLQSFFEDNVEFSTAITKASYLGAIANTFDTVESVQLSSFTLSTPTTNITIENGSIGVLGTILFP